ncbi:unnamed protein product [Ixodes persulcatus]
MKGSFAFLLLAAAVLGVADSTSAWFLPMTEVSAGGGRKCERAFASISSFLSPCRYLCKGWPFRFGNADPGTPCELFLLGAGVCIDGKCVKEFLPVTIKPVSTTTAKAPEPATEG